MPAGQSSFNKVEKNNTSVYGYWCRWTTDCLVTEIGTSRSLIEGPDFLRYSSI